MAKVKMTARPNKPQLANMDAAAMMASMSRPADKPVGEGLEVTESVPVATQNGRVLALKTATVKDQSTDPEPPATTASKPVPSQQASYQLLDRKEVRLWPRQRDNLAELERQLNRTRGVGNGKRITANTLIRIGVDLLLERQVELAGTTEEDLRAAVGLPARSTIPGE